MTQDGYNAAHITGMNQQRHPAGTQHGGRWKAYENVDADCELGNQPPHLADTTTTTTAAEDILIETHRTIQELTECKKNVLELLGSSRRAAPFEDAIQQSLNTLNKGAKDFQTINNLELEQNSLTSSSVHQPGGGSQLGELRSALHGYADQIHHAADKLDELQQQAPNDGGASDPMISSIKRGDRDLREAAQILIDAANSF